MKIVIVGGGAAGMYLAALLDSRHEIHLYEKSSKLGRKFLVAGKGGFNISKNEPATIMNQKYFPSGWLSEGLKHFDVDHKRAFLKNIGIETYIGSSGKIFPERGIKPYEVLNALKQRMSDNGVTIHYDKVFERFEEDALIFQDERVTYDKAVFALGGGSWKKTGSDGNWLSAFREMGVDVRGFAPSNCRLHTEWGSEIVTSLAGKPIKNIRIKTSTLTTMGELLITEDGVEGGAAYAVGSAVREELEEGSTSSIYVDLKPDMSEDAIIRILSSRKKSIRETLLKHVKLSRNKIDLLTGLTTKSQYATPHTLAKAIKALRISIVGMADLDDAISSVGGVMLHELSPSFSLRKYPNVHCIGEMLDWDTITGGYLLQACYTMAASVAEELAHIKMK